jgi:transposase
MKNYSDSVGLDVSKIYFDAVFYQLGIHRRFINDGRGFKGFRTWVLSQGYSLCDVLVCFEHTGFYSLRLSLFLNDLGVDYCQAHALHLRRSIGFRRGKSDKVDAKDIARYAWLNREEIRLSTPPTRNLLLLQQLKSTREMLVRQSVALQNQIKAFGVLGRDQISGAARKALKATLRTLENQIRKVEQEANVLIESDDELRSNFRLCQSVVGIGLVLSMELILHTQNFSCFDSWRQFAAYCGTVPYPYQSGTSIHGRPKVHPVCDRQMKSLLTMASISAIRVDPELKRYFKRRVEEGKPKMSAINMVRNKLLARIFATINRGTPYVVLSKHAA